MTENITKLDELKELADGTENDEKSIFSFYEALLDTELYLLLEKELEGGIACPNLIETPEDKYALVFDTISRLVDFTGNSSPYLALTGRMVLPMLKEQKLGLGLNLSLAVSSEILLSSNDVDWLQNIVEQSPKRLSDKITKFSKPSIPFVVRNSLNNKLSYLSKFVPEAWIAEVIYKSGYKSQLIVFVDINQKMHAVIAKAVNEVVNFTLYDEKPIDVIFMNVDSPNLKKIRKIGISLNFEKDLPTNSFSLPVFIEDSKIINENLKKKNPSQLKELMKISDKIAELNWKRNNDFTTPFNSTNARPSLFTFNGDVYNGIDAFTLDDNKITKAQRSLRILSGLYGVLKPLDLIQAYRLEMGTKITIDDSKNLYEFWKNKVTTFFNDEIVENELFVNLASNEYSSVIDKKSLNTKMVSPIFKDFKNGKLKIISFYAKKARGMMTRFILDNEINSSDDLKGFDYGGYSYDEHESQQSNELVFIR